MTTPFPSTCSQTVSYTHLDHTDVAGTQDHHLFGRHPVVQVHICLGHPRGKHSRGSLPGNAQGSAGPLPAAHGQNHGFGLPLHQSAGGNGGHNLAAAHLQHRGVRHIGNPKLPHLVDEAPGVLRAAEGGSTTGQSESVVDALA